MRRGIDVPLEVPCGLSLALRLDRVCYLLRGFLLGELAEAFVR